MLKPSRTLTPTRKKRGRRARLKVDLHEHAYPGCDTGERKTRSGLSYGDLFIAHAIASASGKSFDQITTLKAKGQTWDKIADDNNVNLGGKKVVKKVVSKATPTPSKKTLRQEQAERYSGRTSD